MKKNLFLLITILIMSGSQIKASEIKFSNKYIVEKLIKLKENNNKKYKKMDALQNRCKLQNTIKNYLNCSIFGYNNHDKIDNSDPYPETESEYTANSFQTNHDRAISCMEKIGITGTDIKNILNFCSNSDNENTKKYTAIHTNLPIDIATSIFIEKPIHVHNLIFKKLIFFLETFKTNTISLYSKDAYLESLTTSITSPDTNNNIEEKIGNTKNWNGPSKTKFWFKKQTKHIIYKNNIPTRKNNPAKIFNEFKDNRFKSKKSIHAKKLKLVYTIPAEIKKINPIKLNENETEVANDIIKGLSLVESYDPSIARAKANLEKLINSKIPKPNNSRKKLSNITIKTKNY